MALFAHGALFAGYRIEGLIGRGGMGEVYRATEQSSPFRVIALKVVTPDLAAEEGVRRRFLRESQVAPLIEHPHVVPVWRIGEEGGVLFIAMRHINGRDLGALLADERRVSPLRAATIVDQIADALDAAHQRGFVHRDVKPSNVLVEALDRREHVYLTDFGLTKALGPGSQLTATGSVVGTIDYLAPEQLRGDQIDARADVYSLGCLLFEALTGRVPFERDHFDAVIYAHLNEPPPMASSFAPAVPAAFDQIVARALAKSPDDRYPSAADLAIAALAAAEGRTVDRAEQSVASGEAAPSHADEVVGARDPQPTRPASDRRSVVRTARFSARRVALGTGGLLAAGAIVVAVVGHRSTGSHHPTRPHKPPAKSLSVAPAIPGIRVGGDPEGIAASSAAIWVVNTNDNTVSRINARTGQIVATVGPVQTTGQSDPGASPNSGYLGDWANGIAPGPGAVWVVDPARDAVTQIDARSNFVHRPIAGGKNPTAIAVADGSAWVANTYGNTVMRIDYASGLVSATVPVGRTPRGVAVGLGSVWVSNSKDDTVTRIDERTGRIIGRPIRVGRDPRGIVVADRSVWVANATDSTVSRIDPKSDFVSPIPVGVGPEGIAAGAGSVWVANLNDGTITRIDTRTGGVGNPIRVASEAAAAVTGIVVADGTVWVSDSTGDRVVRVDASSGAVIPAG